MVLAQVVLFAPLLAFSVPPVLNTTDEVMARPKGWTKVGPFGKPGEGKHFDDYQEQGLSLPQSIDFCCTNEDCEGGGIKGMSITYSGQAIVKRGTTCDTKLNPKKVKTFTIASEADEYVRTARKRNL